MITNLGGMYVFHSISFHRCFYITLSLLHRVRYSVTQTSMPADMTLLRTSSARSLPNEKPPLQQQPSLPLLLNKQQGEQHPPVPSPPSPTPTPPPPYLTHPTPTQGRVPNHVNHCHLIRVVGHTLLPPGV